MNQLPIFANLSGRKVILLGRGPAADAKRRLIERAGGMAVDEEVGDAMLAIVAVEDDGEAELAAARLKARGLLVNVVDRPALCDFTTPAIVDRDPVLIAIGTGGASAGLAKALRQRLEAMLPAELGGLAKALYAARDAIRSRWPEAAERRRAIDAALSPHGPLDPMGNQMSEGSVNAWLDAPASAQSADRIETVSLTSDDPDDLTLRAARLLGEADHVVHDADVPPAILDRARADAERHVLGGGGEVPSGLTGLVVILHQK